MLDKETKDIDAGVELLEDRVKEDRNMFVFLSLFGIAFMTAGLCSFFVKDLFFMGFSLLMAIIMYVVAAWELLGVYHKNQLIFFRKYMRVK
jgi:predicted neutral ceramidase superfamily lipid hydrolase